MYCCARFGAVLYYIKVCHGCRLQFVAGIGRTVNLLEIVNFVA